MKNVGVKWQYLLTEVFLLLVEPLRKAAADKFVTFCNLKKSVFYDTSVVQNPALQSWP